MRLPPTYQEWAFEDKCRVLSLVARMAGTLEGYENTIPDDHAARLIVEARDTIGLPERKREPRIAA